MREALSAGRLEKSRPKVAMNFNGAADNAFGEFIKFHRILNDEVHEGNEGVNGLVIISIFVNFVSFVVHNCFTTTAGFPATTVLGATLFETIDPAATTEFSPIVTPFKMTAFIPIQTLSAMRTGAVRIGGRGGRSL